jgi:hypothetical protein
MDRVRFCARNWESSVSGAEPNATCTHYLLGGSWRVEISASDVAFYTSSRQSPAKFQLCPLIFDQHRCRPCRPPPPTPISRPATWAKIKGEAGRACRGKRPPPQPGAGDVDSKMGKWHPIDPTQTDNTVRSCPRAPILASDLGPKCVGPDNAHVLPLRPSCPPRAQPI